jgi:hypothetical protein
MAIPSYKSDAINQVLSNMIGEDRKKLIKDNRCVPPPIGCGKPALEFKDRLSEREFMISGLCQECQDTFFDN